MRQKERSIFTEVESKGLLAYYELVANQIVNLDQKAESVVNLEGLLLALMAVFTTIVPSANQVRFVTWLSMLLILASAVFSLGVLRVSWGVKGCRACEKPRRGIVSMAGLERPQAKTSQRFNYVVGDGTLRTNGRTNISSSHILAKHTL